MREKKARCLTAGAMVAVLATLSGCSVPTRDQYADYDVGHPLTVQFGTVVASRPIEIKGTQTGIGAAIGGAAGGIGGSTIGAGAGSGFAALGLALVGLAAGAVAEQSITDRQGVEYTVTLQNGQTYTLAQNLGPDEAIVPPGHRVLVQYGYGYMRLLPADTMPTDIPRPQGITVH